MIDRLRIFGSNNLVLLLIYEVFQKYHDIEWNIWVFLALENNQMVNKRIKRSL